MDERQETLREMAALGNWRTVQSLLQAGVHPDGQNPVNGWTALHWASSRGQGRIIPILLAAKADKTIRDGQGRTPAEVAKEPEIRRLLGEQPDSKILSEPSTASPVWTPNYLANPDLSRTWATPDEVTPVAQDAPPREILVYHGRVADDRLLGAVLVPPTTTTMDALLAQIHRELDGIPEGARLARAPNDDPAKIIPINRKQGSLTVEGIMPSAASVIVLLPQLPTDSDP
ncbi:hypothetical protein BJ684DRAFT_19936 [Piptocephalis cylindrospora]|uniref:Uncharacterized protein n=1 Tax=Piptocephalis cylindrospora TaxID=1907219 RepID=A0A4P9Y6U3_9FUNG|nr:hypothetical protein BJ684DRAFT_19936 [Piptocephalis cylindrospora]|eukprot:RKP13580.1 hypothetical protein BJ684DRAFT_19936 [Piptocephalis cylindrospora]